MFGNHSLSMRATIPSIGSSINDSIHSRYTHASDNAKQSDHNNQLLPISKAEYIRIRESTRSGGDRIDIDPLFQECLFGEFLEYTGVRKWRYSLASITLDTNVHRENAIRAVTHVDEENPKLTVMFNTRASDDSSTTMFVRGVVKQIRYYRTIAKPFVLVQIITYNPPMSRLTGQRYLHPQTIVILDLSCNVNVELFDYKNNRDRQLAGVGLKRLVKAGAHIEDRLSRLKIKEPREGDATRSSNGVTRQSNSSTTGDIHIRSNSQNRRQRNRAIEFGPISFLTCIASRLVPQYDVSRAIYWTKPGSAGTMLDGWLRLVNDGKIAEMAYYENSIDDEYRVNSSVGSLDSLVKENWIDSATCLRLIKHGRTKDGGNQYEISLYGRMYFIGIVVDVVVDAFNIYEQISSSDGLLLDMIDPRMSQPVECGSCKPYLSQQGE